MIIKLYMYFTVLISDKSQKAKVKAENLEKFCVLKSWYFLFEHYILGLACTGEICFAKLP